MSSLVGMLLAVAVQLLTNNVALKWVAHGAWPGCRRCLSEFAQSKDSIPQGPARAGAHSRGMANYAPSRVDFHPDHHKVARALAHRALLLPLAWGREDNWPTSEFEGIHVWLGRTRFALQEAARKGTPCARARFSGFEYAQNARVPMGQWHSAGA